MLLPFVMMAALSWWGAALAITPEELERWKGEWLDMEFGFEDPVYFYIDILQVDADGFVYQHRDREVPYGPNEMTSEERHAVFTDATHAVDKANNRTFSLMPLPGNPYAYMFESNDTRYRAKPRFYPTGFNCNKAGTPIEFAICETEVIAEADRALNAAYGGLRKSLDAAGQGRLRGSQRTWMEARNGACQSGGKPDEPCVARAYANRLVALARMQDPKFGTGDSYDGPYVERVIRSGKELQADLPTRLMLHGRRFRLGEVTVHQLLKGNGVAVEGRYDESRIVWPANVDYLVRTSYVLTGNGELWLGTHMHPVSHVPEEYKDRIHTTLEIVGPAGKGTADQPPSVRTWAISLPRPN